jgi:DNA (cytosine-5)-methyltransferase 1
MNTRDYGIPQNRERVYIIGTLKKTSYTWPEKCEMNNINNYIEYDLEQNDVLLSDKRKLILNNYKECSFIDLSFLNQGTNKSVLYSCCLNTRNQIYCVPKKRPASINELLSLQGFDTNFKKVVSKTQLSKQIGNSMSVNVIKKVINNMIYL